MQRRRSAAYLPITRVRTRHSDTRSQRDGRHWAAAAAPDVATVLADVANAKAPSSPVHDQRRHFRARTSSSAQSDRWRGRLALCFIAAACILALMMT